MQDEKEAFKEKINQMERKILADQAQIRDSESKIKIIDEERLSTIASKTNLQHAFTELQVKFFYLMDKMNTNNCFSIIEQRFNMYNF